MTFKDIFDFSRNASDAGRTAEIGLSGYIPKQPNEDISFPPHDPYQPKAISQQDPKIVRETAPQVQNIFNFISQLTTSVKQSADTFEVTISDPASIVAPAASVMDKAQDITGKVTDNVPSPSIKKEGG